MKAKHRTTEQLYKEIATAEILRIARVINNYSQEEMGQMLDIPRSTVTLMEGRKRTISDKVLLRYFTAFNITQADFGEAQTKVMKLLEENPVDWLEITHIVVHMLISAKNK